MQPGLLRTRPLISCDHEFVRSFIRIRSSRKEPTFRSCDPGVSTEPFLEKSHNVIQITNPDDPSRQRAFSFDGVFDASCRNSEVFAAVAEPLVTGVMQGFSGCICCYGDRLTGKTFTLNGTADEPGIIHLCVDSIFDKIDQREAHEKFLVTISMLDIFKEEIFDCLDADGTPFRTKLRLREDMMSKELWCPQATEFCLCCPDQSYEISRLGSSHREALGQCAYNAANLTFLRVHYLNESTGETRTASLLLADLKSSGRVKRGQAGSRYQQEMIKISWGLSCLGNVIMSLTRNRVPGRRYHIPYRDSRTTALLKDALGGCTRTTFIGHVSSNSGDYSETLSTLRYMERVMMVQNTPRVAARVSAIDIKKVVEDILTLQPELSVLAPAKKTQHKKLTKLLQVLHCGGGAIDEEIERIAFAVSVGRFDWENEGERIVLQMQARSVWSAFFRPV